MSQTVLIVREPWHHKSRGILNRGDMITDPVEVADILATRPHSVTKRMSMDHEDEMLAPPPVVVDNVVVNFDH